MGDSLYYILCSHLYFLKKLLFRFFHPQSRLFPRLFKTPKKTQKSSLFLPFFTRVRWVRNMSLYIKKKLRHQKVNSKSFFGCCLEFESDVKCDSYLGICPGFSAKMTVDTNMLRNKRSLHALTAYFALWLSLRRESEPESEPKPPNRSKPPLKMRA